MHESSVVTSEGKSLTAVQPLATFCTQVKQTISADKSITLLHFETQAEYYFLFDLIIN